MTFNFGNKLEIGTKSASILVILTDLDTLKAYTLYTCVPACTHTCTHFVFLFCQAKKQVATPFYHSAFCYLTFWSLVSLLQTKDITRS